MTLTIEQLSVDAVDAFALGSWWARALEWTLADDAQPGGDEIWIHRPDDTTDGILFVLVPENKTIKNRLHLDLRPDDQATEVDRLVAAGATVIDIGQGDVSWVVLADPEGNEFCILSDRKPAQQD